MKIALNPKDKKMFATCGMDKMICIFNLDTFTSYKLKGHKNGVCAIAFSDKNISDPLLVSGSDDLSIIIHDYLNRSNLKVYLQANTSSINDLIFIPNTTSFMSCSEDFNMKF
mmetsp:Transcript_29682/g.24989  ORF Transcript_29682/g.24989 Transcript_29682/m.24989 type:complete len:112 (+) Transcript_29682:441-776(+)